MIDRALTALGIDPAQWRALARTYVRLDFRSAGGAMRQGSAGRRGGSPLAGLLIISGIGSFAFASIAAALSDPLMSASLLTTYAAATTMMLLLVDFTGVVVSPDDYGILGHRPVGSRTYFAARLAAIAVYVGAISIVIALLPAVVYSVKLNPIAGAAAVLAVLAVRSLHRGDRDHRLRVAAAVDPPGAPAPRDVVLPAGLGDAVLLHVLPGDARLPRRVPRSDRVRRRAVAVGDSFDLVRGVRAGGRGTCARRRLGRRRARASWCAPPACRSPRADCRWTMRGASAR